MEPQQFNDLVLSVKFFVHSWNGNQELAMNEFNKIQDVLSLPDSMTDIDIETRSLIYQTAWRQLEDEGHSYIQFEQEIAFKINSPILVSW